MNKNMVQAVAMAKAFFAAKHDLIDAMNQLYVSRDERDAVQERLYLVMFRINRALFAFCNETGIDAHDAFAIAKQARRRANKRGWRVH